MTYIRFTKASEKRLQAQHRSAPFRLVIAPMEAGDYEADCDPKVAERQASGLRSGDLAVYSLTIDRTCPHGDEPDTCVHWVRVAETTSVVATAYGAAGEYSSPYFVQDLFLRHLAWDLWQATAGFTIVSRAVRIVAREVITYIDDVSFDVPVDLLTDGPRLLQWVQDHPDLWLRDLQLSGPFRTEGTSAVEVAVLEVS
ncbi:hypothetical protein [Nonomuraea jabiensis]|uniref:hypothetical protein n=1 Tax=Nonomuraea jabiensis TaxID=882448 RepID=UPI003D75AB64